MAGVQTDQDKAALTARSVADVAHVAMKRAILCAVLLGGSTLPFAEAPAPPTDGQRAPRRLAAGAATSNITPPLGELIVGNWTPAPATHVHDELQARCLVLDDGETRVAIVVADNGDRKSVV